MTLVLVARPYSWRCLGADWLRFELPLELVSVVHLLSTSGDDFTSVRLRGGRRRSSPSGPAADREDEEKRGGAAGEGAGLQDDWQSLISWPTSLRHNVGASVDPED